MWLPALLASPCPSPAAQAAGSPFLGEAPSEVPAGEGAVPEGWVLATYTLRTGCNLKAHLSFS